MEKATNENRLSVKEQLESTQKQAAKRLVDIRKQLEIGQKQMATRLGVSQSYYSDIENGRRSLSNKFIIKTCEEFDVSRSWLLFGMGDIFNPKKGYSLDAESVPLVVPSVVGTEIHDYDTMLYLDKSMAFDREFEKHISEEHPIKVIDYHTKEILMFRIPYNSIMKKYIEPAQYIVDYKEFNKLSFGELKKLKIENLEKLIPHKEAISKLANAMKEFISEMDASGVDWLDFT